METIEISDDETDNDEVEVVEVTPPPPPPQQEHQEQEHQEQEHQEQEHQEQPTVSTTSDPELEAALAGLDKDTEKQVHTIVQEITKHVESDMWKLAYETANQEKKVNIC